MTTGALLADGGTGLIVAGLAAVFTLRGRYRSVPLVMLSAANLAAGAGNLLTGHAVTGAGNLVAAVWFAGLWWHDHRQRASGDPPWLREALAADARKRAERYRPDIPDPRREAA